LSAFAQESAKKGESWVADAEQEAGLLPMIFIGNESVEGQFCQSACWRERNFRPQRRRYARAGVFPLRNALSRRGVYGAGKVVLL
jgi:hypothetical protein